jgi:hypothetical protein
VRDTAALGDEGNQVNKASASYPKIELHVHLEGTEYRTAARLGVPPQVIYQAGVQGALCDEETRAALRRAGEACASATAAAGDQAT